MVNLRAIADIALGSESAPAERADLVSDRGDLGQGTSGQRDGRPCLAIASAMPHPMSYPAPVIRATRPSSVK
jgi:hypothetical protein